QQSDQAGGLARRQRCAGEPLCKTAAVHVFQRQKRPAFRFADLVNLDDVGVLETSDRLGLSMESSTFHRTTMHARNDHLEGDRPLEALLDGLINDAHAAATQLA